MYMREGGSPVGGEGYSQKLKT